MRGDGVADARLGTAEADGRRRAADARGWLMHGAALDAKQRRARDAGALDDDAAALDDTARRADGRRQQRAITTAAIGERAVTVMHDDGVASIAERPGWARRRKKGHLFLLVRSYPC